MRSTLFEIFGIPIRSYGLMVVVGFALGLWRAMRVGPKYRVAPERIYDLALVALLSGVVGARLAYVLLNHETETLRDLPAVWNGGLSFHGGVVFAVAAAAIYARLTRLSFWSCADLLAPSVAIGYAFARIGCFLNGCCYGAPTSLPWGVSFHEHGAVTAPSHPTQIYASFASLLIFLILTRLEKLGRAPGFVFIGYLGLYSIYRFLIEFLRKGYSAQAWMGGITEAQAASLLILTACLGLIVLRYRSRQEG